MAQDVPWRGFASVSFAYFASIGFFTTYAPLWFKSLGYGALAIGLIASLQAWTRILVPYAWGWLADHTGKRVLLLRCAAVGALLWGALLWPAHGWNVLPAAVFLLFLCNGGVVPLSEAALARFLSTGAGMDVKRYGQVRVWGSVGFILTVTSAGLALESLGIDAFVWGVPCVLLGLVLATLRLPVSLDRGVETGATAVSVREVLAQPAVRWFFATVFFTVLGHTSLYAFLSLMLDEWGYSKTVVGLVWAAAVAAEILFFAFGAARAGRLSPQQWLWWAAVLSVVRFAAIAWAGDWLLVLILAQLLHGITFAAQHAACTAQLHQFFPGRLRGRGQALYAVLGYGLSGVIGGAGGGLLTEWLGLRAVFSAAAVCALVAVVCAGRLRARLDVQSNPPAILRG